MIKTQVKKIAIIIIYAATFLVLIILLFFWLGQGKKGSCSDGILNQNEAEVDCGGVCPTCVLQAQNDIRVNATGFLESGIDSRYDLYGEIENPNDDLGSSKFEYSFSLKDSEGNVVANKIGEGFILPGEKKYLVENNIEAAAVPKTAELEIKNTQWIKFEGYEKPQLKIVNKNYQVVDSGAGSSEVTGILRNETPFEFNAIKVQVILKDANQKIIALNSTVINSVRSGESREFRAFWPNRFSGEVADVEVQADVNIFDSESFAKKYLDPSVFQQNGNKYR